jgi:hypothetical protein
MLCQFPEDVVLSLFQILINYQGAAGSIPDGVIRIFQWHNPSGRTMALGVDSASNRNEYQVYFLGEKGGRCVRLTTLTQSCAVVMKCGNLNFLEPSGPLQACNGTALPICIK